MGEGVLIILNAILFISTYLKIKYEGTSIGPSVVAGRR
jgi:hypothetical protein